MNKEKVKEYFKENWRDYAKAVVTGIACGVCYNIGYKACKDGYDAGLNAACLVDPELKGRIIDATKIAKERLS